MKNYGKDNRTIFNTYNELGSYDKVATKLSIPRHKVIRVVYDFQERCTSCGKDRTDAFKTCQPCRENAKKRRRITIQDRKSRKVCVSCEGTLDKNSTIYCTEHLVQMRENSMGIHAKRMSQGLCTDCGSPLADNSLRNCESCLDKRRSYKAATRLNGLWLEVLDRDNKACVVCGGDQPRLEVHHIIPDGPDELSNLITMCLYCHRAITALHYCPNPIQLLKFYKKYPPKSELGSE